MSKRIALFGGSFDPPHLGHKALVEAAFGHLALDEVWVIPVGLPVHRQLSGKATPKQRLSWLASIFADEPRVRIVDWEVDQNTPTPAIATLRRFRAENPDIVPLWLMGMDSFLDMCGWVEYPKHQDLCNVVVFARKGQTNTTKTMGWQHAKAISDAQGAGHVLFIQADLPDVSATKIRHNPSAYPSDLHPDTCKAILACYASD